ncbi:uncharacterized protein [Watersipora subatra]|uniref:uncharacterized protein n=1 Tax=Watersipora subatra TaxID=2589382 RepID=UPI00355C422A
MRILVLFFFFTKIIGDAHALCWAGSINPALSILSISSSKGALCTTGIRYGACRIGAASLVSQTLPDNPDTLPKSKDLDAKFSTQVHANCGYLRTRIYQSIMFLTKNCGAQTKISKRMRTDN